MVSMIRPSIFFGVLSALFIYGNSRDPKAIDNWSGNFLLACAMIFAIGWYFAPARAIWLGSTMRGKPDAERVVQRQQIIGWLTAWVIINITLLVVSQVQNGFWQQLFRH